MSHVSGNRAADPSRFGYEQSLERQTGKLASFAVALAFVSLVVATVWLVVELSIFRDAAFKDAYLYVVAIVLTGPIYLAVLLARNGIAGLAMPDLHNIDAVLDHGAGADQLR